MRTTLSPSTPLFSRIRSAALALPIVVLTACDGIDGDSAAGMELALDDENTVYSISPQVGEAEDGGEVGELPAQLKASDGSVYPLVGNGWARDYEWSTDDEDGHSMGTSSQMTCFLSGVAGNLNNGQNPGFGGGALSRPSKAHVYDPLSIAGDDYHIVARGGATQNQANQQVWTGEVYAQATCIFTTVGQWDSMWEGGGPVKIAELNSNTLLYKRQCFLTGIDGVDGTYNSSRYARVIKRTLIDATHPTTGWYIESDLPMDTFHGSRPRVYAGCIDLPSDTVLSSGSLSAPANGTNSATITSGAAVKACALTAVVGAFNQDDPHDGALMTHPPVVDGDWSLTVKNGKTAAWACAQ